MQVIRESSVIRTRANTSARATELIQLVVYFVSLGAIW
jgi:hypothetical protein